MLISLDKPGVRLTTPAPRYATLAVDATDRRAIAVTAPHDAFPLEQLAAATSLAIGPVMYTGCQWRAARRHGDHITVEYDCDPLTATAAA